MQEWALCKIIDTSEPLVHIKMRLGRTPEIEASSTIMGASIGSTLTLDILSSDIHTEQETIVATYECHLTFLTLRLRVNVEMEIKDQQARDTIANVLDRNMMVLAGAGAGKTYALVQRMVNAVKCGFFEVDEMAAITFTRKAAGEMRGRFYSELHACSNGGEDDEAQRIQKALGKIDQCFIGTIHSFCSQLLCECPLEAGLPPDFTEIDPREEQVMRREAWDRYVQQAFFNDDQRLKEFELLGMQTGEFYEFFEKRCQYSDIALRTEEVEKPNLDDVIQETRSFMDLVSSNLPDPMPGKQDGIQSALERAQLFLANRGLESDPDRILFLKIWAGKLGVTLKNWAPAQEFARSLRDDLLPHFQNDVIEPVLVQWRQYLYPYVSSFVDDVVRDYAETRYKNGHLTFQDLLESTAELLRENSNIRQHFQDRYKCLLVDEFQDTDPIQAELVMYLCGKNVEEIDWRRIIPRSGSLFLVGDGKQSIYRFRRADVDTFKLIKNRIHDTDGEVVSLNTNFRSTGKLCDWINSAFDPLFSSHNEAYQAEFSPMLKYRPDGQDDFAVRKLSIEKVYRNNRRDIVIEDAGRIANFISSAIEGDTEFNTVGGGDVFTANTSPSDFLILARTSGYLSYYAEALEARGIPFDITGGTQLGGTNVLHTLLDFFETLDNPDNPLTFLAYLRGELVGAGDDALYAFKKSGGVFNWQADLPSDLDSEILRMFEIAVDHLKRGFIWMQSMTPGAAIEKCIDHLGILSFVRGQPMGATTAGNILRILALIKEWGAKGYHWGQIIAELRELRDDPEYRIGQMTLNFGQEGVVRIMNLHQSKGLQSKVVFLTHPYDTAYTGFGPDYHVSRAINEPYLAMPIFKPKGPYSQEIIAEPVGWEEDKAEEGRFLKSEELRLLYVAATRAENLLVISNYIEKPKDGPWSALNPYLENILELEKYPRPEFSTVEPSLIDLQKEKNGLDAFWESTKKEAYVVERVSENYSYDEIVNLPKGKSVEYGAVIRQLFDAAINRRLPDNPDRYVQYLLRQEGANREYLPDVLTALKGLYESDLWVEIQNSETVYTEVPFATSRSEKVVRGIIGLIYRSSQGWKIVDYKTNAVGTAGEIEILMEHVSKEIEAYAQYWLDMTGEDVVSKGVWLVENNSLIEV